MQVLKKILQSKYLIIIFLLIIIISYYRTNNIRETIYKGSEQEFKLEVVSKKYKDNKYTITLNPIEDGIPDKRLSSLSRSNPFLSIR